MHNCTLQIKHEQIFQFLLKGCFQQCFWTCLVVQHEREKEAEIKRRQIAGEQATMIIIQRERQGKDMKELFLDPLACLDQPLYLYA